MPQQMRFTFQFDYGKIKNIVVDSQFSCRDVMISHTASAINNRFNNWLNMKENRKIYGEERMLKLRELWNDGNRSLPITLYRGEVYGRFGFVIQNNLDSATLQPYVNEIVSVVGGDGEDAIEVIWSESEGGRFEKKNRTVSFVGNQRAYLAMWWASLAARLLSCEGRSIMSMRDLIQRSYDDIRNGRSHYDSWNNPSADSKLHLELWEKQQSGDIPQVWRWFLVGNGPNYTESSKEHLNKNTIKRAEKQLKDILQEDRLGRKFLPRRMRQLSEVNDGVIEIRDHNEESV